MEPGAALPRPTVLEAHGHIRVDDFYWMAQRGTPEVEAYLTAENSRADAVIGGYSRLRTVWEDAWRSGRPTAPSRPAFVLGGFLYEWQAAGGTSLLTRRIRGSRRRAQTVVDASVYGARGLGFNQGGVAISPDHRRAAVAFERVGSERFTIRLRDIDRNRDLGYAIEPVGSSVAWLDDQTILYTRLDDRGVPSQAWRHRVGEPSTDALMYQEADPTLFVGVSRTTSGQFGLIVSTGHSSSESRLLPAHGAGGAQLVVSRRAGVTYHVEAHPGGGVLYALVHDDDGARVMASRGMGRPDWSQWETVYVSPGGQRAFGLCAYAGHIVVAEDGREPRLAVIDVHSGASQVRPMDGVGLPNTFSVQFGGDFGEPRVWIITSGPADPGTFQEVDPVSGASEVIHHQPAPKGFHAERYAVEQWHATAPDGTSIPLSVFYSPAAAPPGGTGLRPAVLNGYGAFGISTRPGFSQPALSLADRGWVIAHAHVRGGGELGPAWHAAGRRLHKRNSIDDFVACAQTLAQSDLVDAGRLAARGASAGGLLVCAAVNQQPDLFRAVVARVPPVDCLTSLLDPDNRLTRSLWDELGNPIHDAEMYHYILSYSPYDNIRPCRYPAMLVTGAYRDARVPYWEPAKFVARLRVAKTDDRVLLLRTAMQSGHNDRFDERSDESYIMAFLVSQLE